LTGFHIKFIYNYNIGEFLENFIVISIFFVNLLFHTNYRLSFIIFSHG
jgi:hypothetical protein